MEVDHIASFDSDCLSFPVVIYFVSLVSERHVVNSVISTVKILEHGWDVLISLVPKLRREQGVHGEDWVSTIKDEKRAVFCCLIFGGAVGRKN